MPRQTISKLDDHAGSAVTHPEFADTPKLADTPALLLKEYKGKQGDVAARLQADSLEMASEGYFPTWQNWAPGVWSREAYIVAVLLVGLFGLGILIFAYLLVVEPDGTLSVAYERRAASGSG